VLRGFLDDLQRHDFTVLDTPEPDLAYLFKHVVTQEVAYSLLLSAQRRQLHRAVAEWYEQTQAEDPSPLYPLLAYHWGRAEEPTRTLAYLELAGEQALRVGAYQEAVELLTEALSRSGAVQPAPEALRQARWHRQLGDAYEGLGRLPESRQHAERAVALLGWPVQRRGYGRWGIWPGRCCNRASAGSGLRGSSEVPEPAAAPRWRQPERMSGSRFSTTTRTPECGCQCHSP
jgi:tetratricopeptide (TPR) repeat protein